jgi:localization factor PodJL
MNKAISWSIKGLDDETLDAARAAARRAGKSLGDWLDEAVQEKAASFFQEEDESDEDEEGPQRIVRPVTRSPERGRGLRERRRWRKEGERARRKPRPAEDPEYPSDLENGLDARTIVDNAAAIFEQCAAGAESKTSPATESFTRRGPNGGRQNPERDEGLSAIIDRLTRIENKISQQAPAPRPAPTAPKQTEARNDQPPDNEGGDDFEQALQGLDQRLSEIADRLDQEARGRKAKPIVAPSSPDRAHTDVRGHAAARRPLAEAIAEITQRQRVLESYDCDDRPDRVDAKQSRPEGGLAPTPAKRFDHLREAIESIAKQIESVRNGAIGQDERQRFVVGQIEALRDEIDGLSRELRDLAPRSSIASVEAALRTLADRIEAQRSHGMEENALAPIERLTGDLRSLIKGLDPGPIVRGLQADVQAIGRKLDGFEAPGGADSATIAELTRQTSEIRDLLTSVAARPLPIEKLESRLFDLTRRLDGLSLAGGGASKDLTDAVRSIRSIIVTETSGALNAFGDELDKLGARIDELLFEPTKHFDELGERLEEVHKSLAARIDRGVAQQKSLDHGQLEQLLAKLAKKIGSSLEPKTSYDKHFADLAQRIDSAHKALAARIERGGHARETADAKLIHQFLRQVNEKLDAAMRANGDRTLEALQDQIHQLSERLDQGLGLGSSAKLDELLSRPAADTQFEQLARRVDSVYAALAQKIDQGLRSSGAGGNAQLAGLVGDLARKIDKALDPKADGQAIAALEQQIEKLSKRLDRTDKSAAALIAAEQTLGDLFRSFEEKQDATNKAAESAARKAAQEALREGAGGGADGLNSAIERELAEIRQTHHESGRHTHETLAAVHDTLKRVVDRLATFEEELTEIRSPPPKQIAASAPGEEGATAEAMAASARIEALRPSDRSDDSSEDEDILLEPRPNPRGGRSDEDAWPASIGPAHERRCERPLKSDFIAAARRAAQEAAAKAEAAQAAHPRNKPGKAAGQASAGGRRLEIVGSALQARKRPLLLALGALVLIIGAYQIARVGIQTASPPARLGSSSGAQGVDKDREGGPIATTARPETGLTGATPAAPPAKFVAPQDYAPAATRTPAPPTHQPPPEQGEPSRAPAKVTSQDVDATPVGSIDRSGVLATQTQIATLKTQAAQGDASAQFELGVRYAEGRGAARNLKMAAQWFEKAASQGVGPAEYRLGSLYEKGVGVERDYLKARSLYQRAAERGNARAMHNLAVLFAEGGDGKPDYASAASWFSKAAEFGVRDSQYNLAILYARGLGVIQSLKLSYMWFTVAAGQGDDDAAKKRDEVGSRLDSKELAAAKALANEFRPKPLDRAANEVASPAGGSGSVKPPSPKPGEKPSARPKISTR